MCGIAGIVASEAPDRPAVETALERMMSALDHRGPDDRGSVILDRGRTALGNTRLAIQDLSSAGHQPMHDRATGNWIVLNGEIYNHLEVRRELQYPAGEWQSSSDTETFLKAYGNWGPKCLERFRGMFAVAIWDRARGAVWCARDRLGMKPFYYAETGETVIFASEIRSLVTAGFFKPRIDRCGLAGYVRFGCVPEPTTLLQGVMALPAGQTMWIRGGRAEQPEVYWKPRASRSPASRAETAVTVKRLLERSVREHLLADVPVATFLSGGVDSSIITALAARLADKRVQSITFGFREVEADESRYSEKVVQKWRTDHHRVFLSDQQIAQMVPESVEAMDSPSADGTNTYVVSRVAASAGNSVVLSGLGADELFGGYRSFDLLSWAERLSPLVRWTGDHAKHLVAERGGSAERGVEIMFGSRKLDQKYESLRSFWSRSELANMGVGEGIGFGTNGFHTDWKLKTQVSWLELSGYMRSTLLRDSDSMGMAHSLEIRLPFLDHELVECCLEGGAAAFSRGSGNKDLLLAAAGELLPDGIAERKKQCFTLPMSRWMRGPLAGYVAEGLRLLARAEILPQVEFEDLHQRFVRGALPWARLWQFVVLGHWVERNLS